MVKGNTLHLTWHVDDLISRASDRKITLSKKQAKDILLLIDRNHDCSVGVSWDTIDYQTDVFLQEKGVSLIDDL